MTLKDRTSEFATLVENLHQRKQDVSTTKSPLLFKSQNNSLNQKTQFSLYASQIGRDIAATYDKLERLTKLAKKKNLYDDPSEEIQELIAVVNQDIKNLNNQINFLQQHKASIHKKNKQSESHTDTVVESLKSKLRHATKDFSQVLELRTETLKNQQKERETFMGNYSPAISRTVARTAESPLYKLSHQQSEESNATHGGEVAIAMPAQAVAMMTQDRYLENRAEAVQTITRTIGELQSIFQQLATLVAEQQEMIERIDSNVENAVANVNTAQTELMKYLHSVSSNRALIFKVFFVLIVFIILFIMFFV